MRKLSKGFSMIEVLVAISVLSVGLLGLAGMQALGLRNNQSAYYRSQATELAYSMADRMRANIAALASQSYDQKIAQTSGDDDDDDDETNQNCESSACGASDAVTYDIQKWRNDLRQLPKGVGYVCRDATPNDGDSVNSPACSGSGNVYAIKIWWDDSRSGAADRRVSIGFQP